MKWEPGKVAGAMYVLPVLAVAPMWYILLFVGNPPSPNYEEMLHFFFVEDSSRKLFWYHAALPVICGAMAAAYLLTIAPFTIAAKALFVVGVVVALSAWLLSNEGIAIFATLPLMFSVKAAWHLTNRWSGP